MVQIAWQLHDDDGTLLENQDYLIKPEDFDIPFNASRIHGHSQKWHRKKEENLIERLVEFSEVLKKSKIGIGHNIIFDYNIVGAEFLRKNLENPLEKVASAAYHDFRNRLLQIRKW
ncbi:exonuclease domain-containing protein [Halpernia sp. GG3]